MADQPTNNGPVRFTYTVTCRTDGCEQKGNRWDIWPVENQPGLFVIPFLVCGSCKKSVYQVD